MAAYEYQPRVGQPAGKLVCNGQARIDMSARAAGCNQNCLHRLILLSFTLLDKLKIGPIIAKSTMMDVPPR